MDNRIDIDLFRRDDGSAYFIVAQQKLPSIRHNPMIPQALSEITDICKRYNLNGFTLYLDPITAPPALEDE